MGFWIHLMKLKLGIEILYKKEGRKKFWKSCFKPCERNVLLDLSTILGE